MPFIIKQYIEKTNLLTIIYNNNFKNENKENQSTFEIIKKE